MRLLILLFSWLSLHCTLQMTVFVFQLNSFLKLSRTLYLEILYNIISIKQLCSIIESLFPPQSSVVRLHLLDYWTLIKVPLAFFAPLCFTSPHFRVKYCVLCRFVQPKRLFDSLSAINDKEKQQILLFEKLEPVDVWHFCLNQLSPPNVVLDPVGKNCIKCGFLCCPDFLEINLEMFWMCHKKNRFGLVVGNISLDAFLPHHTWLKWSFSIVFKLFWRSTMTDFAPTHLIWNQVCFTSSFFNSAPKLFQCRQSNVKQCVISMWYWLILYFYFNTRLLFLMEWCFYIRWSWQ